MPEDEFSKLEERAKIALHSDIVPRELAQVVAQGALRLIAVARAALDAGPPVERYTAEPMTEAELLAIAARIESRLTSDTAALLDEVRRLSGELGRERTKVADWRRAANLHEAGREQAEHEITEMLERPIVEAREQRRFRAALFRITEGYIGTSNEIPDPVEAIERFAQSVLDGLDPEAGGPEHPIVLGSEK